MVMTSDNQWHSFIHGHQLTKVQKEDFDWMDNIDNGIFVRYNDSVYSVSELMRFNGDQPPELQDYDAYLSESAFSALVIKVSSCGDYYKIAFHHSKSN